MSSLTLAIPAELKQKMKSFRYINWSEVARAAIIDKMGVLEKMNKLLSHSALTEENTLEYGKKINKRIWKRHRAGN